MLFFTGSYTDQGAVENLHGCATMHSNVSYFHPELWFDPQLF